MDFCAQLSFPSTEVIGIGTMDMKKVKHQFLNWLRRYLVQDESFDHWVESQW